MVTSKNALKSKKKPTASASSVSSVSKKTTTKSASLKSASLKVVKKAVEKKSALKKPTVAAKTSHAPLPLKTAKHDSKSARDSKDVALDEQAPLPPRVFVLSREAPKDGPSDEAVFLATGKTWDEWFSFLDTTISAKLEHRGVVAAVKKLRVDDWWSQMIAGIYEKGRGRSRGPQPFKPGPNKPGAALSETIDGFEIGVSRTLGVAVGIAFDRFATDNLRRTWLPESIEISRMTRPRSVRAKWKDDSRIDINFYPKGEAKCQVSLQHGQLETPIAAEAMKEFWGKRLDVLQGILGEG